MRTTKQSNDLLIKITLAIRRARHEGIPDERTSILILDVIDTSDIHEIATGDDFDAINRIAHGAQRGDTAYCLNELRKSGGGILREVVDSQRLEIIRLRALIKEGA